MRRETPDIRRTVTRMTAFRPPESVTVPGPVIVATRLRRISSLEFSEFASPRVRRTRSWQASRASPEPGIHPETVRTAVLRPTLTRRRPNFRRTGGA